MADVLEITVRNENIVRVNGKDYALVFTIPATAELEGVLGRSMKHASDWFKLQTGEVQATLEAGFKYRHPDEAAKVAEEICTTLDPEGIESVIDAVCAAACPKAVERLTKELEKARERVKQGMAPLPNVPGVAAS